jgi:ABC-2 type transporter
MARSAVLAGRTLADLCRSLFSLAVMVGLGLLVGFRFHSTTPRILAGMALIIAFGYAFSWMYAAIGLATKDPETAQIAGILPFFVLMFASNAVVPVETMPGWLQPFARNQPLSVTVSALSSNAAQPPTGSGNPLPGAQAFSSSSSSPPSASTATPPADREPQRHRSTAMARPGPARVGLRRRRAKATRLSGGYPEISRRPAFHPVLLETLAGCVYVRLPQAAPVDQPCARPAQPHGRDPRDAAVL